MPGPTGKFAYLESKLREEWLKMGQPNSSDRPKLINLCRNLKKYMNEEHRESEKVQLDPCTSSSSVCKSSAVYIFVINTLKRQAYTV